MTTDDRRSRRQVLRNKCAAFALSGLDAAHTQHKYTNLDVFRPPVLFVVASTLILRLTVVLPSLDLHNTKRKNREAKPSVLPLPHKLGS